MLKTIITKIDSCINTKSETQSAECGLDPYLQNITELADRLFCIYGACRETGRGRSALGLETAKETGRGRRALGLETAKEILEEVFHTRPGEVEEMIQRRLEESGPEEREEGLWPATF